MSTRHLKDSIEHLKALRVEIHDDIDSRKLKELDQIIDELESGREVTSQQALILLGKALRWLPGIVKIIENLTSL